MEDNSRARIVEKIKKLFRLSTSPNEHEAALALQRAMELMEKYGVDSSEVKDQYFQKHIYPTGPKYNEHETYIVALIESFFHVKMVRLISKPKGVSKELYQRVMNEAWENKYEVYGKEHHIIIAEFVFEFLSRTFVTLWKKKRILLVSKRMQRKRRKQVMMNYFTGLYSGLYAKLWASREVYQQEFGLIHLEDEALQQFVEAQDGVESESLKRPRRDDRSLLAGYVDGKQIEIHKTITSADGPVRQIGL